jgi:two-component system KDP operon response regulator KdpE
MENSTGSDPKVSKILVVDDELPTLRILKRNLTGHKYAVLTASDGLEALRVLEQHLPDLMLLDLTMPKLNGLEVIRRARQWNQLPIIVLSALGEEHQKVEALELGADDYLTKPFGMNELIARIKVALRRVNQKLPEPANIFSMDGLEINFTRRLVTLHDQEVKLTPQQYDLLRFLVQNAGRVVTHRLTLLSVWGPEYEKENQYLHVFIGQLRQKIEPDPARPHFILTERGVGYRFRSPDNN